VGARIPPSEWEFWGHFRPVVNIGYDEPKVVRQLAAAMRSFAVSTAATYLYTGTEMDGVQCIYTVVDSPLLFLLTVGMGVNATGTLGVAGRAPKKRESRRRGGSGRGCAPSEKIYEFFFSKWCDMVHSGCVVFKIHVSHGL